MLYTRCPNCQTTFRITADTLRVASGAVRCGNCATVYSAFSGLPQDALDPGMQVEEDFLSPTLQTQELAAIEDIASPDLDEAAPQRLATAAPDTATAAAAAIGADRGREQYDAAESSAPATEPTADDAVAAAPRAEIRADTIDFDAQAGAEFVAAPAAPADALEADHADDADEASGATSGTLEFVAPANDEWAQLLKEIEDSASDEEPATELPADSYDEPVTAQSDDDDVVLPDFWDIGEPESAAGWDHALDGDAAHDANRVAAGTSESVTAQAAMIAEAFDTLPEIELADLDEDEAEAITAEQIDATLSADLDADVMAAFEAGLGTAARPTTRGRTWRLVAGFLALMLIGQLIHHNRASLATQPVIGTIVQRAYALVGVTVSPSWNLAQYEITNWAATAGETGGGIGDLRITAQIRNDGPAAQPFPSIQLELKDRWESVIGSRVFSPREYLGDEIDSDQLMPAGQTVPAQLAVVDPGLDASGFELDVCLANGPDTYRCSADRVFE